MAPLQYQRRGVVECSLRPFSMRWSWISICIAITCAARIEAQLIRDASSTTTTESLSEVHQIEGSLPCDNAAGCPGDEDHPQQNSPVEEDVVVAPQVNRHLTAAGKDSCAVGSPCWRTLQEESDSGELLVSAGQAAVDGLENVSKNLIDKVGSGMETLEWWQILLIGVGATVVLGVIFMCMCGCCKSLCCCNLL